jgi:hypothetical protein
LSAEVMKLCSVSLAAVLLTHFTCSPNSPATSLSMGGNSHVRAEGHCLLDTNICTYIAKRKPASVLARLEQLRAGDVGMSVVTDVELVYGAWK